MLLSITAVTISSSFGVAASPLPTTVGIWASDGKNCDAAKMYLVITDTKIVAVAPGLTVTKIGDIIDIEEDGSINKIALGHQEQWHLDFRNRSSGSIVKLVKAGKDVEISEKQRRMMMLTRCKNLPSGK